MANKIYAPLAQLVEQLTLNQMVGGSNPLWRTKSGVFSNTPIIFQKPLNVEITTFEGFFYFRYISNILQKFLLLHYLLHYFFRICFPSKALCCCDIFCIVSFCFGIALKYKTFSKTESSPNPTH